MSSFFRCAVVSKSIDSFYEFTTLLDNSDAPEQLLQLHEHDQGDQDSRGEKAKRKARFEPQPGNQSSTPETVATFVINRSA
jgi:hypothetical protein